MTDEGHEIRIADADRERVIDQLRTAVGEGRISLDEFSDRAGEVYAARTQHDLRLVVNDLPSVLEAPPPPPAAARVDVPAPATTRGAHLDHPPPRRLVAVMNGLRRRGRWRLGARTSAIAFWGSVDLDLRGALLEAETIVIDAWAVMGSVEVVLPEGVPVELTGMVVMGATSNRVRDVPVIPGAPLVHVRAHGLWGSVLVRSKPPEGTRRSRRRARREARHTTALGGVAIPPMPQVPPIPIPKLPAPWIPMHEHGWDDDDDEVEELVDTLRDDPSELRATAAPDGTVTILFSDIEGSTELADRLGDHRWVDVLRAHNELIRAQIAKHGGREVKVQGDGFMVAFSSAIRALRCAMSIQRSLAAWRSATTEVPLHVRIGVHTGEVISDGDDFLGKHVMVAARIVGEANGDQILTSSIVRELTDGGDVPFDEGRDVELRGFPRSWRLYAVDWTTTSS